VYAQKYFCDNKIIMKEEPEAACIMWSFLDESPQYILGFRSFVQFHDASPGTVC
jgi:hypothetical protein